MSLPLSPETSFEFTSFHDVEEDVFPSPVAGQPSETYLTTLLTTYTEPSQMAVVQGLWDLAPHAAMKPDVSQVVIIDRTVGKRRRNVEAMHKVFEDLSVNHTTDNLRSREALRQTSKILNGFDEDIIFSFDADELFGAYWLIAAALPDTRIPDGVGTEVHRLRHQKI